MNINRICRNIKKSFLTWVYIPEKIYLFIALTAVIGFTFITPPFQGPDEPMHYFRVQYMANGYLIPVNPEKVDASLPNSINKVMNQTFYDKNIRGDTNQKYDLHNTKAALKITYNDQEKSQPVMVSYAPITYFPAVPFVALSNAFNLSPLISLYLARLALGVTSVILFFFAIKLLPYKKYLLVVIGLIPMVLFQQSVVTADGISYALLALFMAYLLHLRSIQKPSLDKSQWIKLALICFAIMLSKPLVFVFLPLIFLLINKKNSIKWIIGIGFSCLLILLGTMAVSANAADSRAIVDGTSSEVNSVQQTKNLEENPKRGLRVLWNSYMTVYGDDEVRGVIGVFGAADTIYPLWMFTVYVILLGLYGSLTNEKKMNIPKKWLALTGLLSVIYFLAVNYALYTGFTPVNFNIIYGVQGRYFLPIIIASIIFLMGGIYVSKKEFDRFIPRGLVVVGAMVFLALFITIQRYYLYTP